MRDAIVASSTSSRDTDSALRITLMAFTGALADAEVRCGCAPGSDWQRARAWSVPCARAAATASSMQPGVDGAIDAAPSERTELAGEAGDGGVARLGGLTAVCGRQGGGSAFLSTSACAVAASTRRRSAPARREPDSDRHALLSHEAATLPARQRA